MLSRILNWYLYVSMWSYLKLLSFGDDVCVAGYPVMIEDVMAARSSRILSQSDMKRIEVKPSPRSRV